MRGPTRRRRVVVIWDKRGSKSRGGRFEITIGVLASLIGIAPVLVFAVVYCWHVAHAMRFGFPVEFISVSPLDFVLIGGYLFSVAAIACISTIFLVPPLHVWAKPNADGRRSILLPLLCTAVIGIIVIF